MTDRLLHGDCLELMKDIPDNSVDLTVTSPPYDNLRSYNGIKRLIPNLRNIDVETLERAGLDSSKIGGYYK